MGKVVFVSDSEGKQVAAYGYTSFGKLVNQVGNFQARFLFSCKELDTETGLINFGYRHLNPRIGRWMSRDLIGERDGANLYVYVQNHPTDAIDALGLLKWRGPCFGVGAYLGFIGGSIYDCDLWSDNFKRDDGCCYKQWVKVRATVISLGFGIGVSLFGKGAGDASEQIAVFDAPAELEWRAFRGSIELEKALELDVFGAGGAVYSSFWLGRAKYKGRAVLTKERKISSAVSITGFIKSLGHSFATCRKEYRVDCTTGEVIW